MKSHNYVLATIALFVVLGMTNCSSQNRANNNDKNGEECPIIDLEKAIEEESDEPLPLSDFIEDIEYIRPEYPKTLVSTIFDLSVNDNYLLLEVGSKLLCYTREGKFLREIGHYGQGPEEHIGIRSHALYNNLIAINSIYGRKMLWYDANGNYIRKTPISGDVYKINILDTNRIAIHLHHGEEMDSKNLFIAGVIDDKGDTIQLKKASPYYPKGTAPMPSIWKFNDTIRVLTCINDTVYSITKNKISPTFVVNFGKYKISQEAFENIRVMERERSKYIDGTSFCETSGYILIMFQYDNKQWIVVYNKKTAKTISWSNEAEEVNKYGFVKGGGWVNDIDGGAALNSLRSITNDYLTTSIQPDELKTKFEENKENIKVKYPNKQKQLNNLINSLNEDENPIVILYKLKKN